MQIKLINTIIVFILFFPFSYNFLIYFDGAISPDFLQAIKKVSYI